MPQALLEQATQRVKAVWPDPQRKLLLRAVFCPIRTWELTCQPLCCLSRIFQTSRSKPVIRAKWLPSGFHLFSTTVQSLPPHACCSKVYTVSCFSSSYFLKEKKCKAVNRHQTHTLTDAWN